MRQTVVIVPPKSAKALEGHMICTSDQDDAFDNCVKVDKETERDEDIDVKEKQVESNEFGNAAMDLVQKVTNKLYKSSPDGEVIDPTSLSTAQMNTENM